MSVYGFWSLLLSSILNL